MGCLLFLRHKCLLNTNIYTYHSLFSSFLGSILLRTESEVARISFEDLYYNICHNWQQDTYQNV